MHIGELAERSNLSLRTLRHYDEVGLLRPSGRTDGGFRIYSEKDYERLILIRQVRALGFSLEEIAELLDALNDEGKTSKDVNQSSSTRLHEFLQEACIRRETMVANLRRADALIAMMSARIPA